MSIFCCCCDISHNVENIVAKLATKEVIEKILARFMG
nr:MAG TPA: hypothetical protein [Caudoviricetes sp.]